MKKPLRSNWIVRMTITKDVDVYCENCTEEEARTETFAHSVKEQDVDMKDWDVISVEENK